MSEFISKAIKFIFGVMMLLVVGLCFFGTGTEYIGKVDFALPNIVYALLGGIIFLLVGLAAQGLGKCLEKSKHAGLIMTLLSVLFFFGLVALTYHYYFKTGWDAHVVELTASTIAGKDWDALSRDYFSYYPNNIFLTFLFSVVIRMGYLVGITNHYFCVVTLQCFLFALTGLIIYHAAALWMNRRAGLWVWAMYILMVGLSPWVVVPYSDSTGVLFPTLLFYLYVLISKGKHVNLSIFLLALCSYIGYRIKPQIFIVTIAILIVTIASFRKGWLCDKKHLLKKIVVCVAGLLVGILVVTAGVKATHLEADEEKTFGIIHFLMIGLNEEAGGRINLEDQDFSMSFDNAQDRAAGNWQVVQERVKELGPMGLLRLWRNKILTNFADGTFAWWQEGWQVGGFLVEPMYDGNLQLRNTISNYYYEGGSYYSWFLNYSQTLWMGILAAVLLSVFLPLRREPMKELDVLRLSLIGIAVFEMIFEARARYLFIYVPLFILAACMTRVKSHKGGCCGQVGGTDSLL